MRDVCRWWRARSSQLLVLCTFALILVWQSMEVRRGEGFFRRIVAEVRESFRQQEIRREVQFARLLKSVEDRMNQLDREITAANALAQPPAKRISPVESNASKPGGPR